MRRAEHQIPEARALQVAALLFFIVLGPTSPSFPRLSPRDDNRSFTPAGDTAQPPLTQHAFARQRSECVGTRPLSQRFDAVSTSSSKPVIDSGAPVLAVSLPVQRQRGFVQTRLGRDPPPSQTFH